MTNPTPHGQVPEALRLAHIFDNPLPPEWPDMVAAAAELRRQHARIAELEALGGVQSLSLQKATPAGVDKAQAAINSVAGGGVQALSAAPADVAEQGPVAHDEELLEQMYWEFDGQRRRTGEERLAFKGKMRSYASEFRRRSEGKMTFAQSVSDDMMNLADRLGSAYDDVDPRAWKHLLVYAPKAAPGEPSDVEIDDFLDSPACITWIIASNRDRYRLLVRAVLAKWAAPQPSPAAQGDAIEHELAMLIRRIVSSARRNCEDGSNVLKLANEAWAYLVRKGLNGSPLRDAGIESDPTPPAKAADSVQEDAARWRMAALIGNELMLHPDKRTHATAVKAYMDATHSGSDLTGAVDAALAAQGGKDA